MKSTLLHLKNSAIQPDPTRILASVGRKLAAGFLLLLAGTAAGQVLETNWETGIILLPVKDAATHAMLRASLRDTDPLVRIQGLVALTTIRDPADESLIRALQSDPVAAVREQARPLPRPCPAPLVAPANPADWLSDSNVLRRQVAVDAIAQRQLTALATALPPLLNTPDSVLRRHLCEALGQLPAGQSSALATQLARDDDPLVRRAAANALLALHTDDAAAALVKLLQQDRAAVRVEAARALGEWAQPAIARALHALLMDAEPTVARTAAEAIGKLANPESQSPLLAQLPNSPVLVQERIAWALGELKTTAAVPLLRPLLKAGPEMVEASAAEALGKIGDVQALPELRKILVDMKLHGPLVRQRALEALRRLGDRESTQRVVQFVTEKVVPPLPGMMPSLWTYDLDNVRAEALLYLGSVGTPQLVDEILTHLKEAPSWSLRRAMVLVFTKLTGEQYWAEFAVDTRHYWMETLGGEFYPRSPNGLGIVRIPNQLPPH